MALRQGRVPHDAFEGEEKVEPTELDQEVVLGDEHPVVESGEEDLDPEYQGPSTA